MSIIVSSDFDFKEKISSGFSIVQATEEGGWPPCYELSKVLDILNFEFPFINIIKIDGIENKEFAREVDIKHFPTLILYKDGKIVEKHTKVLSQDELIERIRLYQY